jgi:hypothetical protein
MAQRQSLSDAQRSSGPLAEFLRQLTSVMSHLRSKKPTLFFEELTGVKGIPLIQPIKWLTFRQGQ